MGIENGDRTSFGHVHMMIRWVLLFIPLLRFISSWAGEETPVTARIRVEPQVQVWLRIHNDSELPAHYRVRWLQPEPREETLELNSLHHYFDAPPLLTGTTADMVTYEFSIEVQDGAPPVLSWTLFSPIEGLVEKPITSLFPPTIRKQSLDTLPADKETWIRFTGSGLSSECSTTMEDSLLETRWLAPDTLVVRIPPGPPGPVPLKVHCGKYVLTPPTTLNRVAAVIQILSARWDITPRGLLHWIVEAEGVREGDSLVVNNRPVPTHYSSPNRLETSLEDFLTGPVTFRIVGPNGRSSSGRSFEFNWKPIIREITPTVLDPEKGGTVTFRGDDFTPGLSLQFSTLTLPIQFIHHRLFTVDFPPHPRGEYPIHLLYHDGSVFDIPILIRYDAPPVIENVQYLPNPVVRMSSVQFEVQAYDPEGGPLTYEWSVLRGPVSNLRTRNEKAVADVGDHLEPIIIEIKIRDSAGNEVSRIIRVDVM